MSSSPVVLSIRQRRGRICVEGIAPISPRAVSLSTRRDWDEPFIYELKWTSTAKRHGARPSIFTALEEQLGLNCPATDPVDFSSSITSRNRLRRFPDGFFGDRLKESEGFTLFGLAGMRDCSFRSLVRITAMGSWAWLAHHDPLT